MWVRQLLTTNYQLPVWTKHIDQIPISYDLARDKTDNLLSTLDNILPEGGNGIYENGNLKATYTNDSATIQVSSKLTSLSPGKYLLKVVAVDKYGHAQETLPQELIIQDPLPYRVNPKKPRVQSVSTVASPSPTPTLASPKPQAAVGPRPSPARNASHSDAGGPSLTPKPYWLNPIVDFLNALFH